MRRGAGTPEPASAASAAASRTIASGSSSRNPPSSYQRRTSPPPSTRTDDVFAGSRVTAPSAGDEPSTDASQSMTSGVNDVNRVPPAPPDGVPGPMPRGPCRDAPGR